MCFISGIHITSDVAIVVQAINIGNVAADGVSVPPVSLLGKVYVAVTYKLASSSSYQGPYEIGIVAAYPNTEVQVTLQGPQVVSVNFDGTSYSNGDRISTPLEQYETAQVNAYWLNINVNIIFSFLIPPATKCIRCSYVKKCRSVVDVVIW